MITIGDTLRVEQVHLHAAAASPEAAIDLVAASLRSHPAVQDWEKLAAALRQASPCAAERGCDFGICIPHARSNAVSSMVMSVGRFDVGVSFECCPQPIRYVFCIGLPSALNADYLRIVGLLARILKAPDAEKKLHQAATAAEFVAVLSGLEARL
jgi:mannitol/fructose-specific phosphotransferase system IIA component (Ntr-type)